MYRPAFRVVSGAVAVLVAIGFASRVLLPHIPKPVENAFANDPSEFLSRSAAQRIDWRKPIPESFAEARRKDKPILLFIGTSYNPFARALDEGVMMSPQVQAYLARNFLCIRADALAYPEFRSAYLPRSRALAGLLPGFQIWVLDPSGKVVDQIPRNVALYGTDETGFIEALVRARRRFENPNESAGPLDFNKIQNDDLRAMREMGPATVPSFEEFTDRLLRQTDSDHGGFTSPDFKLVTPEAWRYLLTIGQVSAFRSSFDPVLQTPAVDLLDGGFFHIARSDDWSQIEFEKSAVENAAMLRVLTEAYGTLNDPLYRWFAERTFDCLSREMTQDGVIFAARVGDAGGNGRSERSSFGVRKLRESLEEERDHTWAQIKLGLRVETNPRMVPCLTDPKVVVTHLDRLESVLKLLRRGAGARPERVGGGYLDVSAFVVARLIESARVLGDKARMEEALTLFDKVENFRTGDDVIHCDVPGLRAGYLGDYLAYADACLQHYLATGRYDSLQSGKAILVRALFLFGGKKEGVLNVVAVKPRPMPTDLISPELSDPVSESTTAQAIRLCQDYARIFFGKDDEACGRLRQVANGATSGYATIVPALDLFASGYFCAATAVFDDTFVVTCGPNAQPLADAMAANLPTRLVVPAFGDIRHDLQKKGPGIYIVRGLSSIGPLTVAQARTKLSPYLGVAGGT